MSSAIKSFLVMMIMLPLLIFIGSEVGNDDYLLPIIVCVLMVGALVFGLFFRGQRVECLVLALLLGGYFVGNRGFAQLYLVQPFFIGEVGMLAILALMVVRYATTREFIVGPEFISRLIAAYLVVAFIRLCFDWSIYGIDAVRDSAIVYYAVFFFFGYQLGRREETTNFLDKFLVWIFFCQAVVGVIFVFEPEWLDYVSIRGVSLFLQKGDLTATFSALGIIFIAVRSDLVSSRFIRYGIIILLTTSLLLTFARAALVALVVTLILTWVAARRGFVFYPAILGAVGLASVFALGSIAADGRFARISDQMTSIVDISGNYHYQTDLGDTKQADNKFRRALWDSMYKQTVEENQWLLGKGFGYDFMPAFQQEYRAGTWDTLRSAHNYFVTIFARLGLLGLILFVAIAFEIFRFSVRSALQLRRGERHDPQALAYWCFVWAILVSGTLGVVLEGPMGAIPFWSFAGLALAVDDRKKLEARAEVETLLIEPLHERSLSKPAMVR